jgi:hypothetical protein
MENLDFLIFLVLVLVFVSTGLFMVHQLLFAPTKLLESVFPRQRPRLDLFGPPNPAQSDTLVIYVCSRAFAFSFVGLILVWFWRWFTRGA